MRLLDRGVEIKSADQVEAMRRAGLVVAQTLALLRDSARAGMTTGDLDRLAEQHIHDLGATSNFKGYHGFPATICTSVNDEVVHGIPGGRRLADGDIVSIDCGAVVDGWHGDAAVTVPIGEVAPATRELLRVCEESLWRGIAGARLGGRVGDIGRSIERHVRSQGSYGIVEEFVGHGIGSAMHQPPDVPNYARRGRGPRLVQGLVLAVEPMITAASTDTQPLDDGWTVVTADGSWSAHFEHTVTYTEHGVWVLTALDAGRADLGALAVPYGGPG